MHKQSIAYFRLSGRAQTAIKRTLLIGADSACLFRISSFQVEIMLTKIDDVNITKRRLY